MLVDRTNGVLAADIDKDPLQLGGHDGHSDDERNSVAAGSGGDRLVGNPFVNVLEMFEGRTR